MMTKIKISRPAILPIAITALMSGACATQTVPPEHLDITLQSVEPAKIEDFWRVQDPDFAQAELDGHIIRFEMGQNMRLGSFVDTDLSLSLHYFQCVPDTGNEYVDTHNRDYLPHASSVVSRAEYGSDKNFQYESTVLAVTLSQVPSPICAKFIGFNKKSNRKFSVPVFTSNDIKLDALGDSEIPSIR